MKKLILVFAAIALLAACAYPDTAGEFGYATLDTIAQCQDLSCDQYIEQAVSDLNRYCNNPQVQGLQQATVTSLVRRCKELEGAHKEFRCLPYEKAYAEQAEWAERICK